MKNTVGPPELALNRDESKGDVDVYGVGLCVYPVDEGGRIEISLDEHFMGVMNEKNQLREDRSKLAATHD